MKKGESRRSSSKLERTRSRSRSSKLERRRRRGSRKLGSR